MVTIQIQISNEMTNPDGGMNADMLKAKSRFEINIGKKGGWTSDRQSLIRKLSESGPAYVRITGDSTGRYFETDETVRLIIIAFFRKF